MGRKIKANKFGAKKKSNILNFIILLAVLSGAVFGVAIVFENLGLINDAVSERWQELRSGSAWRRERASFIPEEQENEEAPQYSEELSAVPLVQGINYAASGGLFELPVRGATGWAAVSSSLLESPSLGSTRIKQLNAAQPFIILEEQGAFWYVRLPDDTEGWLEHNRAFINLPDIIPSIIYRITNASSSIFLSNGVGLPGVTGVSLFDGESFNERLRRHEYIVPAMYGTAKGLAQVQRLALNDGNTIVVYDAFRPRSVQRRVVDSMTELMNINSEVRRAVNSGGWGISWFISTSLSNHQRGASLDTSLARVVSTERRKIGEYVYDHVTESATLRMPSPMHELSPISAPFAYPVNISSISDINAHPASATFTEAAATMRLYFMESGFIPLASEWWHFDHVESVRIASSLGFGGEYILSEIFSVEP